MNKIDTLIRESAAIEQEIVENTKNGKKNKRAEELQVKSNALWNEAKELGKHFMSNRVYEDIGNLVIARAVLDYEGLISGTLLPTNDCNIDEIKRFAKEQVYSEVNLDKILMKIDRIYEKEFIPYAKEHYDEIIEQWRTFMKKSYSWSDIAHYSKYKCPLCGGSLKPVNRNKRNISKYPSIGCTGCKLEAYVKF